MGYFLLILFLAGAILISCAETTETDTSSSEHSGVGTLAIPDESIDKALLDYDNKTSSYTLDGRLYSGYSISYYGDGVLKEKTGILNGRRQNEYIQYYPDGHPKLVASYHEGKLHGEKKSWSAKPAHVLVAHLNYVAGKAHGEQQQWYLTGELYKKLNLNMGKEEGIQQAYRKNGDLYANYEAREGRIFGMKKAALCFGIEDETIQYAK